MDTGDHDSAPVPTTTNSAAPAKDLSCFACHAPSSQTCFQCHNARYCSDDCQSKDWSMHKFVCEAFIALGPRPSPNHFRGLLIPELEDSLRFVWIKYEDPTCWYSSEPKDFIRGFGLRMIMPGEFGLVCPADHEIGIWYNDAYMCDQSPISPALTAMLGLEISNIHRGSWLAHGYEKEVTMDDLENEQEQQEEANDSEYESEEEDSDNAAPCDLDTRALKSLVGYFEEHFRMSNKLPVMVH